MESRFEAPANKEFFNGIGDERTFPSDSSKVCNALMNGHKAGARNSFICLSEAYPCYR